MAPTAFRPGRWDGATAYTALGTTNRTTHAAPVTAFAVAQARPSPPPRPNQMPSPMSCVTTSATEADTPPERAPSTAAHTMIAAAAAHATGAAIRLDAAIGPPPQGDADCTLDTSLYMSISGMASSSSQPMRPSRT